MDDLSGFPLRCITLEIQVASGSDAVQVSEEVRQLQSEIQLLRQKLEVSDGGGFLISLFGLMCVLCGKLICFEK